MTKLYKLLIALTALFALSGCASIMTSNENNIRVETVDSTGAEVKEANCTILRGEAKTAFVTPAVVPVTKGSGDIRIDCTKSGMPDGKAVVTSRVGAATFGNIIAGGVIGAAVDQATGKAYNHQDGKATPGKPPGAAPTDAPK
jgi:uncharacterized protein YceK